MWDHIYIAEKLAEFREEAFTRQRLRYQHGGVETRARRRALADRLGRALVRLGTRLQDGSDASEISGLPASE